MDARISAHSTVSELVCEVSGETHKEEQLNYLTHLAGFLFSFIGLVYLVYYSYRERDATYVMACWIYGATLVMMYGASTYYHFSKNIGHKRIFRIIDHACIYFLIAGSYTPFTLGPMRDSSSLTLLVIIWTIALLGSVFKVFTINRFKPLSLVIYLGMGWLAMLNLPAMIEHLPHFSIVLLLLGGVAYSVGVFFYIWESLPYNHAIWHLFVLAGSACHYFSILLLI